MFKRIVSGLVGGIFLCILLFFDSKFVMLNILTSTIAGMAMIEIFSVMGIPNLYYIIVPTLLFVIVMPITGFCLIWDFFWYIYTIIMFGIMILNKSLKFKNIAVIYTMAILITFSLNKLIGLRDLGERYNNFYVLLALTIAWMSDTGAYFFGKLFGKTKLCPTISSGKTVEGLIGGFLTCLVSTFIVSLIFSKCIFFEHHINYFALIAISAVGSLVSVFGDLSFSVIKRNCHVKDFGDIIPGHGGILDRFDSLIFVAPYTYFFVKIFPIVNF